MPKFYKLQEGWLTVGLLALVLLSVTLSIQQAKWAEGLGILTTITLVGLLTGLLLSKIQGVPRILLDLVGLLIGFLTVILSVANTIRDPRLATIQERVRDLLERTVTWINVAIRQDASDDLVVFILSLAVVCWVLAYSSAYFIFRARQLWWALVPNGIALLINISYANTSYAERDLKVFLVIFMISSLLLMIRFNLLMKEERWRREGVSYSPKLTWGFLRMGSLVAGALALAMAIVPPSSVNGTLNSMWEKVNQPWLDFQTNMSRLWSQVPGNQSIGGYSSFNKSFTMGGSLNLSNSVALIVRSTEPRYWRATTYDQYTGSGWRNTAADTFRVPNLSSRLALDANQELMSQDEARREVTYTVQVVSPKGDTIFASMRPKRLSQPSRLDISWQQITAQYDLDKLYAPGQEAALNSVPLELRTLLGLLREAQRELRSGTQVLTNDDNPLWRLDTTANGLKIRSQAGDLSRRGVQVIFVLEPEREYVPRDQQYGIVLRVSGEFPVYDDISSIRSVEPLARNTQYTVASLASKATDVELRQAPSDPQSYPQWLRDRYLTLPATVSQRVRDLAFKVVRDAGATNPYDEAKALEVFLRTNFKYSTQIAQPPSGIDRTEWFLFEGKEGYCEYYATAMIVMLRSLGVPTRMATGYAPGQYDSATQTFTVRESSAHAWPEVYFPGYGWIEFEPTPSQAVIKRDPASMAKAAEPTAVPTAEGGTPAVPTPRGRDSEADKPTPVPSNPASGGTQDGFGGLSSTFLMGIAAVGAVLIGLLLFATWRHRRGPATASSYYGRMLAWARFLRVRPSSHQTPYEFTEALAREVPGTSLLARRITRAYVRERYAAPSGDLTERAGAASAWRSLKPKLMRYTPARQLRFPRRGKRQG